MKLGILTSVDTRHRYFANRLRAAIDVAAIGYEETGYAPVTVHADDLSPEEANIVDEHFAERGRQENAFFGHNAEFVPDGGTCAIRRINPGSLNTPDTLALFEATGIDTVVIYGTNLIQAPLLDRYTGRMVNLHLGLSPYYRGTATNFYPLLNEEPEYVGATIHLLNPGIDSGPILRHARPTITPDDRPHTIGCKTIEAGIEAMIAVLRDFDRGKVNPVPQWTVPHPRLYLRKDYHTRQVVDLYQKLDAGLIPRYVEHAAERSARVRLVE